MGLGGEYLCPAQRVVVTCYNIVTESHYCLKLFSTHSIKHLIARINALLEMVKKDNDLSISWTSVIPWPKATQRRTGLLPGDVVPLTFGELRSFPCTVPSRTQRPPHQPAQSQNPRLHPFDSPHPSRGGLSLCILPCILDLLAFASLHIV